MKLFNKTEASAKRLTLLSIIALSLAALTAILRTVSLLFFYDRIGYFKSGAPVPIILGVIYALAIVFFGAAAFLNKYDEPSVKLTRGSAMAALLPCVAFIPYIVSKANMLFSLPAGAKTPIIELLSLLFAIVSAVYFLSLALSKQPSALSAVLGVGCIVWSALAWISSYLDFYVPMNSPDKIFFSLACVGCMLLVLSDVRAIYGAARPKFYYFSFFSAILVIATSAFPNIIGNFKDVFASYSLKYEDAVFAGILIYAIIRLLDKPQKPSTDNEINSEAEEI